MQLTSVHDVSAFADRTREVNSRYSLDVVRVDPQRGWVCATDGKVAVVVPDECEGIYQPAQIQSAEFKKMVKNEHELARAGSGKPVTANDGHKTVEVKSIESGFPNLDAVIRGGGGDLNFAIASDVLIKIGEYLKRNSGDREAFPVMFCLDEAPAKDRAKPADDCANKYSHAVRFMIRVGDTKDRQPNDEVRLVCGAFMRLEVGSEDAELLFAESKKALAAPTVKETKPKKTKEVKEDEKPAAAPSKKPAKSEKPSKPAKAAKPTKPGKSSGTPTIDESWPEAIVEALCKSRDAIAALKPALARRYLVYVARDVQELDTATRKAIEATLPAWNECVDVCHETKKGSK